ncbi:Ig-like domain-containing protein [Rhodococcus sp. ARC_M6]|uniref:Ig-like domain-containing protein n=1 Tax=Rhodococcus sp. ARC_M6 TaxID=2928852 RepID=UPI001FB52D1E|nr:Ig-like domain-containing protein [Rhodococcus sp. ARC_M6]MCJ0905308.1 Ig-like domain-containing protein [Rhodococcus sp. ARC_M6]
MSQKNIRRGIGAVSAFAVAAGLAVTFGTGVAEAVSGSVNWKDGNTSFTRTISDVTPSEGDIITVSTKFTRAWSLEIIYSVKDLHPTCLTYVDGSAKVNGNADGTITTGNEAPGTDFVNAAGSWTVYLSSVVGPTSRTFSFDYKVGAGCDRGVALSTGMNYTTGLAPGYGNYPGKGPTVTVAKNVSTTTLTPIAAAQVGTPVNLSATVTGGVTGDTVEFYDGTNKLGSGVLNAAGVATYEWTPATTGSYSLTAKFLQTTKASQSTSVPQNVTVSAAVAQTMTAITGVGTATTGDSVSLTATVGPNPGGGTVQFKDANGNLGAPVDVDASGNAVLMQAFAEGTHSITAVFSGSAGFGASTAVAHSLTVTAPVVPNTETTTAITGVGSATTGDAVSLTATVAPAPGGGAVQFQDAGGNLGEAIPVVDGKAVLTRSFTEGAHSVTAVFSGVAGFAGSTSGAHSLTVSAPVAPDKTTATALTVPSEAKTGATVGLSAQVSPAPGGGTVQFKDGSTNIGMAIPVGADGKASTSHTFVTVGAHEITAVFSGSAGFVASTSAVQTVTVSAPAPNDVSTGTVLSLPASAVTGAVVELSATVSPALNGGTVQFFDGTTPIGTPVPVVDGKATLSHAFSETGVRQITAEFSGAAGHLPSTSEIGTVTVSAAGDGGAGGGSGSLGSSTGSLSGLFGS